MKMAETELMVQTDKTPAQIAGSDKECEAFLGKIKAEVEQFQADTSTAAGRKEIASLAYKVARTKTAIDDAGKTLTADWRAKIEKVNANRKRARDELDALKDRARKPLNDWEAAEERRIAYYQGEISNLEAAARIEIGTTADEIQSRLDDISLLVVNAKWQEFEEAGRRLKSEVTERLSVALDSAKKAEAEAEELARLRSEEEARERAEAERLAEEKRQAEIRAEADRIAEQERQKAEDERAEREREHKAALEKVEADRRATELENQALEQARLRAEEHAKVAAQQERERIEREAAEEKAREKAAADKRWQDNAYRASAFDAAAEAMVRAGHISNEAAQAILSEIEAGRVPHVEMRL